MNKPPKYWNKAKKYLSKKDKVKKILIEKYKKKYLPPKKFVNSLNKRFSPYCSVATWYLWRSIDNEPIQY